MEPNGDERKEALLAECEVSPQWLQGLWERLESFVEPFARQVGRTLGEPDGILIVDGSAFSKQGAESAGVQRQWSGRAGKIDNCQIGASLGDASGPEQALADVRLFLPQSWAQARQRRAKCHVPAEVKFATKRELARELIETNRSALPQAWVVGDDEFGRATEFRRDLRELGERSLLAVPCNALVRDLSAEPPPYGGRGQRPLAPFVRVGRWCAQLPASGWTRIEVRDGEKGPLTMDVRAVPVLAIKERNHPQRAKSETGLADDETRSWPGWHHHQTLPLLASWFLALERLRGEKIHAGPDAPPSPHRDRRAALARHRPARFGTTGPRDPTPAHPQRLSQILSTGKNATNYRPCTCVSGNELRQ